MKMVFLANGIDPIGEIESRIVSIWLERCKGSGITLKLRKLVEVSGRLGPTALTSSSLRGTRCQGSARLARGMMSPISLTLVVVVAV